MFRASTKFGSFSLITPPPPGSTLFPYTTLFRSIRPTEAPFTDFEFHATSAGADGETDAGRFAITGKPEDKRSEEHTSELQSRRELVCRLLLEKKKMAQHHASRSTCR